MREIIGHKAGRVFLIILFISLIVMLYIPHVFFDEFLFMGFITSPFLAGIVLLLIWLIAYLLYFFLFWPYRH